MLLIFFFVILLNVPASFTKHFRIHPKLEIPLFCSALKFSSSKNEDLKKELNRLTLENVTLHRQNEELRNHLFSEERIETQIKRLIHIRGSDQKLLKLREFFSRRGKAAEQILDLELKALFARVVYREPSSWSSTIWIGVGEEDNKKLEDPIVSINSPVVIGSSVVGIIEYVGKNQSQVRLITDPRLVPSVRCVRGESQNFELLKRLDDFLQYYSMFETLDLNLQEKLIHLQEELLKGTKDQYLAKGELYGTSSTLWRSRSQVLKGVGFNYDFPDEEGEALDLRTGRPYDDLTREGSPALLKVGDLLVTTGMDGIFPPDLQVGFVTQIKPLKEGDIAYELEAKLLAGNLDDLSYVIVLPPVNGKIAEENCEKRT